MDEPRYQHLADAALRKIESMLDDVDTAVKLAEESAAAGDRPAERVLIAAARSTLGKIDERFQLPGGEPSRALLRQADSDLKAIELAERPSDDSFRTWRKQWPGEERRLRAAEPRSLFSEAVLRRELSQP